MLVSEQAMLSTLQAETPPILCADYSRGTPWSRLNMTAHAGRVAPGTWRWGMQVHRACPRQVDVVHLEWHALGSRPFDELPKRGRRQSLKERSTDSSSSQNAAAIWQFKTRTDGTQLGSLASTSTFAPQMRAPALTVKAIFAHLTSEGGTSHVYSAVQCPG